MQICFCYADYSMVQCRDVCSSTDNLEPRTYDPVILEAIELFERLEAEEEETRNGMAWMQGEVTEAFKIHLSSTGTKVLFHSSIQLYVFL